MSENDGKTLWYADIDNGITTDGKKFFCERCNDKELAITCLKAHAVEVLANAICPDGGYVEQFRAEARALLGWEE